MTVLSVEIIVMVVCALLTNAVTQTVKKKASPTEKELQTINLLSGFFFGMVGLVIFDGDFATYGTLGLAAGFLAPGIYDIVSTFFDWKGASK